MGHLFTLSYSRSVFITCLVALSIFFTLSIPQAARAEGLGSQIVCLVFSELNTIGTPIPFLEAEGCPPDSTPVAQCADGIDNDSDGAVDFPADLGCANSSDTTESPDPVIEPPVIPTACLDGIDNDGDGLIDWSALEGGDPGCTSPLDEDETNTPPPPPPAACADGIDNDSDGLVDHPADPGCADATDTDETNVTAPPPPVGGGGGGSGSGGGGGGVLGGGILQTGQVLGVATVAPEPRICDPYIKTFIKLGRANDRDDVGRLQSFLNQFEGATLEVTNEYDLPTFAAVKAFQNKYLGEVLSPWGIGAPTGYVYLTTRKKINEIHCNASFPLSANEEEEISRFRGAVLGTSVTVPVVKTATPVTEPETTATETVSTEPPETTGILGRVRSFFDRLFGRSRAQ